MEYRFTKRPIINKPEKIIVHKAKGRIIPRVINQIAIKGLSNR